MTCVLQPLDVTYLAVASSQFSCRVSEVDHQARHLNGERLSDAGGSAAAAGIAHTSTEACGARSGRANFVGVRGRHGGRCRGTERVASCAAAHGGQSSHGQLCIHGQRSECIPSRAKCAGGSVRMQKEAVKRAVFGVWRGVSERDEGGRWQECDCRGKIGDSQAGQTAAATCEIRQDKAEWLKRRSATIRTEAATGSSRTLWHLVRQLSGSKKARGPKPVTVIATEERGRDCGSVGKHLVPGVLMSWGARSAKGP